MSDETTTILFYHQISKHLAGLFLLLAGERKDNTAPGAQVSANDFLFLRLSIKHWNYSVIENTLILVEFSFLKRV